MVLKAGDLLKRARLAEKCKKFALAFGLYRQILDNFPTNRYAIQRSFEIDVLQKKNVHEVKENERCQYRAISEKMEMGITDLDELNLKNFVSDNPSATYAYPVYGRLLPPDEIDKFVRLVRVLLNPERQTKDKIFLLQALFICAKRKSQLQRAFQYLRKANEMRRKFVDYNPKRDKISINLIKDKFQNEINFSDFSVNDNNVRFIFIVGMPRSGTTLIEQIICNAKDVTTLGEVPFATQFMSNASLETDLSVIAHNLGQYYLQKVRDINKLDGPVVDKMPFNLFWLGFLALSFPKAKFIHCKRDARATCWSNFETFFAEGNDYSFNLAEVVQHYNNCEDLMRFWKAKLSNRLFTLKYENFTANSHKVGKKLFDFLELDWEDGVLDQKNQKRAVKTASQLQVKREIYSGSSLVWKKFEPFIGKEFDNLMD